MFHLFIIGTETTQRLSIISGTRSKNDTTSSKIAEISPKATNVSLQKYIIGVSSTYGNEGANTLGTNRNNKYAVSKNEDLWDIKYDYNHTGVNISSGNNVSTSNITGYNKSTKKETPVQIEAGDKVTYKIAVYNNSNVKASYIKIKDFYQGENATITEKKAMKTSGSTFLTYGNAGTLSQAGVTQEANDDNGNTVFSFSLEGHERLAIYITVRYNSYSNSTLRNRAWISSTTPSNKKTYRTIDADYIKMKQYSVSLEKFISKVNDTDITGREGKRYNDQLNNDNVAGKSSDNGTYYSRNENVPPNHNTDKLNNPVYVEPGDNVTYTIRLKNTGKNTVKITQIYDTFRYINNNANAYNGLKLELDENYGVKDSSGKQIVSINNITKHWTGVNGKSTFGYNDTNEANMMERILINLGNNIELAGGASKDVTIRFKVVVPTNLTNSEQTDTMDQKLCFFNKAGIVTIKNRNNVEVLDSDGKDNNYDMDWVKTKTYAVSLEKYISKVNNVSVHNLKYDVNGDGAVDLKDVELILKYIAKQPVNLNGKGDFNNDGTINMIDVIELKNIIREGKPEHDDDDDVNTNNYWKNNNVVTVQSEDTVTYTIKVKNDSKKTGVYINQITDKLDSKGFDNRSFNILTAKKYNKSGTELSNILSNVRDVTVNASSNIKTITIDSNNNTFLNYGDYISIIVSVKVTEPNISLRTLPNTAEISGMKNKNNVTVKDTTPNNNKDSDYIKLDWTLPPPSDDTTSVTVTKEWIDDYNKYGVRPASVRVVLYKIVDGSKSSVGGAVTLLSPSGNKNTVSYTWTNLPKKENGKDIKYEVLEIRESGTLVQSGTKYNNNYRAYYVDNSDNTIFTIKNIYEGITDDKTSVTVTKEWQDEENKYEKRPASIEVQLYKTVDGSTSPVGSKISLLSPSGNNNAVSYTWTNLPKKENGKNIKYTVKEVSVPDGYTVSYSLDTFHIINKYGDKPEDAVISGIVWNDIATNKTSDDYDGLYQKSNEQLLSGIKVLLYRNGVARPIAKTTTDSNGYYYFNNYSIDTTVVTDPCEQYIKAPIKSTTDNKWAGTYYSYYVVFEYDGVTYTSTPDGKNCVDVNEYDNYKINSNAKEDGIIKDETRQQFNSRFNNINNGDCVKGINTDIYYKIEYSTKNDAEKAPQSNHIYDPRTMAIHSCTGLINFNKVKELTNNSDITTYEDKIKNVNLGLRGRDVFDLELTSDVVSTEVRVNGVDGTYNYGNKVTVRRNDLSSMYNVKEDMANVYGAGSQYDGGKYEQRVRKTDIDADQTGAGTTEGTKKYDSTGLGIKVTYRITVTNASQTDGTATKIINYYDNRYTFKGAYANKADAEAQRSELEHEEGTSGTGYKSVLVTTKGNNLTQGASMDIYLVYSLNSPTSTLSGLLSNEKLPTYNMAEIYEYKTQCGRNQTEYTRGLIDKDSAPGSVATEKVRLASGNSTDTTLGYYFKAQNLQNLKYEDDTYAAPTLYFVSDDSKRTINGTVFEDYTQINSQNVKSGNGVKDDDEPGIYGATVELIENNSTVRYSTTTNEKGEYTFSGFLPGNYIIKYHYGDTEKTVVVTDPNKKSYNGEDFQATNNSNDVDGITKNKLSARNNYWYLDNESRGISVATDNSDRRKEVSRKVTDFTDDQMTVLNNLRAKKNKEESKVGDITVGNIINDTKMNANTANMLFEVEKPEIKNNKVLQTTEFKDYVINQMNFGIAEVPVTTIDLQKHVQSFTVKDSTGQNEITKVEKTNDGWKVYTGIADPSTNGFATQIEDEKLQGARLEVAYNITSNITVQKNFDGKDIVKATITGLVDYIDNDLSYNENLGANKDNWVVTNYTDVLSSYKEASFTDSNGNKKIRTGTVDSDGTKYTTIVKLKDESISKLNNGESIPITLEKVLSSTDSTIDEIIRSTVDTYEYNNVVEITGIKYDNTKTDETGDDFVFRDRVRTPETNDPSNSRMIILAGGQYDSATSETISIIPPTGDSNVNIIYYVIAAVSLVVIAAGTFGIKKFVLKK